MFKLDFSKANIQGFIKSISYAYVYIPVQNSIRIAAKI